MVNSMTLDNWQDAEHLGNMGMNSQGLGDLADNTLTFIQNTLASCTIHSSTILSDCGETSIAESVLHTKYSDDALEKLFSLMAKTANHILIVKTMAESNADLDTMLCRDAFVKTIRLLKDLESKIIDLNGTTYEVAVANGSAMALGHYYEDCTLPNMFKTKGSTNYDQIT